MDKDSGDELGGYELTTPAAAKKPRVAPRPLKAAVAGPSKSTAAAAAKKAVKPVQSVNDDNQGSETRDVVVLSSDEDGRKAPRKDTKGKGKEPVVNAKVAPQTNGKGKQKGKVQTNTPAQPMEVDNIQSTEEVLPLQNSRATRVHTKPISEAPSPPPAKRHKADSALESEIARLKRRLDEVATQRDRLSEQLKDALEIRETEPERLLAEGVAQYEASMQAQQHLLQEQAASLAQLKALPESKQLHSLQFITRDTAAEESKGLTERMKKLEQNLKDKNARISELEAKNKDLDKQLEAEIQMAKEYREKNSHGSKPTTNGPVRVQSSSSTPLEHDVVKLYEDLSNFLVTKVVPGPASYPSWSDLKEKTFHCTYTYVDVNSKGINPSLQFTLRHMWLRSDGDTTTPPTSKKDLVEKIEYIPVNLENESEQFKESLEFFSTAFIFERSQMHVFMRSLTERLASLVENESEEEGEAS